MENIDTYISEEEKKEIARKVFKETLRDGIREISPNRLMKDYERIISNAVFHFIEDSILEKVHNENSLKEFIKNKTKERLKEFMEESFSIKYALFDFNVWNRERPIGDQILKEILNENKNHIKEKLVKALMQMKVKDFISVMEDYLKHKLK